MVEPRHMRHVVIRSLERTPEEKLVEPTETAIGIATHEVHVHRFKIGRRIGAAHDDRLFKILDMVAQHSLDAVGKGLAQRLGPAPIRRAIQRARRIALDEARRVGQLQPEDGALWSFLH